MTGTPFSDDDDHADATVVEKNHDAFSDLYDKYAPALNGIIIHAVDGNIACSNKILTDYFFWLSMHFKPSANTLVFTWLSLTLRRFINGHSDFHKWNTKQKNNGPRTLEKNNISTVELLKLLSKGYSKKEIALHLNIPLASMNAYFRDAILALRNKS